MPPLALQWDVGQSVLAGATGVQALIKAATLDNVQPAALLAAEALGGLFMACNHRTNEGIHALQGNKDFRIENLKLTCGLSSGGAAARTRAHPGALRTFLLISCLKLHLEATDIGKILYELMAERGLLSSLPVTAEQIERLVEVLAGHSVNLLAENDIVGIAMTPFLDALAASLGERTSYPDGRRSYPDIFRPLSPTLTPPLCVNIFEALMDPDIVRLDLRGSVSIAWLYSVFYWLSPPDVGVYRDGLLLAGDAAGKICFHLADGPWTLQAWRKTESLASVIVPMEESSEYAPDVFNKIPPGLARLRLKWQGDVVRTTEHSRAVGEVAVGMIQCAWDLLVFEGRAGEQRWTVAFKEVCREGFQHEIASMLNPLGWTEEVDWSRVCDVRQTIKSYLDELDAQGLSGKQRQDFFLSVGSATVDGLYQRIEKLYPGETRGLHSIGGLAAVVANHCILGGIMEDRGSFRKVNWKHDYGHTSEFWFLRALGAGCGDIAEFINEAYDSIVPNRAHKTERWDSLKVENRLAMSAGGQVVYPKFLRTYSTDRRAVLLLTITPGHLSWNGRCYPQLDEVHYDVASCAPEQHLTQLESVGLFGANGAVREPRMLDLRRMTIEPLLADWDGGLLIHWKIFKHDDRTQAMYANARAASIRLALACHVRPRPMDYAMRARQLADMAVHELIKFDPLDGARRPALTGNPAVPAMQAKSDAAAVVPAVRAIYTCTGNPAIDFLIASDRYTTLPFVVQGEASILESILQAEEAFGRQWIILSSP